MLQFRNHIMRLECRYVHHIEETTQCQRQLVVDFVDKVTHFPTYSLHRFIELVAPLLLFPRDQLVQRIAITEDALKIMLTDFQYQLF